MKQRGVRPSPAMVVACVSLFVALGGSALAASYVVSSNSQVGPGTISGHKPPTGKHANIIAGSVNGADLAGGAVTNPKLGANAVTGGKVVDNSLLGADVNESTLNGSQITGVDAATLGGNNAAAFAPASAVSTVRVPFDDPVAGDGGFPSTTLVDTGPIQVIGQCADDLSMSGDDDIRISVDYTNSSLSSEGTEGTTNSIVGGSGSAIVITSTAPGVTDHLESAHFIAVPASGPPLAGFVSAELNDQEGGGSDCTFGVDLIGG